GARAGGSAAGTGSSSLGSRRPRDRETTDDHVLAGGRIDRRRAARRQPPLVAARPPRRRRDAARLPVPGPRGARAPYPPRAREAARAERVDGPGRGVPAARPPGDGTTIVARPLMGSRERFDDPRRHKRSLRLRDRQACAPGEFEPAETVRNEYEYAL